MSLTKLTKEPIILSYDHNNEEENQEGNSSKRLKFELGFTRALNSHTGWFHLKVNGEDYDQIMLLPEALLDESSKKNKSGQ